MRDWLTILKWSASEDRQKQAEHDAEDDAGNDGEIKCGMFALDPDVAGQSSQPFRCEAAPHYQSHQRHDYADDDHEFSELTHRVKVAQFARRHKVESRWRCNSEIITKLSGSRRRPPGMKFARHFASWRGNITPMWRRTKRPPRKNLRRSMKLTRS